MEYPLDRWTALFNKLHNIVLGPYCKLFRVLQEYVPDDVPTEDSLVLQGLVREAQRVVDAVAGKDSAYLKILDEVRRQMPDEAVCELVTEDTAGPVDPPLWNDLEMD